MMLINYDDDDDDIDGSTGNLQKMTEVFRLDVERIWRFVFDVFSVCIVEFLELLLNYVVV